MNKLRLQTYYASGVVYDMLFGTPTRDKIGGASEKKIEQALFFPLSLHYLCIR